MKRRLGFLLKGKYWETGKFPYTDKNLPPQAERREEKTDKTTLVSLLKTMVGQKQQQQQQQQQQPQQQQQQQHVTGVQIGTIGGDMLLNQVWFKVKRLLKAAYETPDGSIDREEYKKALGDSNWSNESIRLLLTTASNQENSMFLNFETHPICYVKLHSAWDDLELQGKVDVGPPDLIFFRNLSNL